MRVANKTNPQKRAACSGDGILVASLSDSVISDAVHRTGYIASNYQFQFDAPPQAGALYTAGFSHCANGSLAFGNSTVFYQCRSGDFYNLYDRWWAEQCSPVEILVMPCGTAEVASDQGQQVVGTTVVATTVVMPLSDGQPQVITTSVTVRICQITDGTPPSPSPPTPPIHPPAPILTIMFYCLGQIQAHTTPCTLPPSAATATPAVSVPPAPVSQYSDGQIQVTPVPGAGQPQTTLRTTASGPAIVPTSAPGVNGASGGRVGHGKAVYAGLLAGFLVGAAIVGGW
jgi:hypothetical protein